MRAKEEPSSWPPPPLSATVRRRASGVKASVTVTRSAAACLPGTAAVYHGSREPAMLTDVDGGIVMGDKKTQPSRSKEESSPLQVVQAQVDAYNHVDIDAFLNTYAPEVNLYNFPDELLSSGLASMRENYAKLFEKAPQLHASITNRITQGNYVIDQEFVTGISGAKELAAVAIYEMKDGKIVNVLFLQERL
jgi:hypothetical protein